MPLFQIAFYSRNHVKLAGGSMRDMVRDILAACNRYDRASGLTGALVFNEDFFLQAMEGERAVVSDQLWAIAADSRHSGLALLAAQPIRQRAFEGWMVGYAGHSAALDALYTRHAAAPRLDPTDMPVESVIALLSDFAHLDGNHFVQRAGPAAAPHAKDALRRTGG